PGAMQVKIQLVGAALGAHEPAGLPTAPKRLGWITRWIDCAPARSSRNRQGNRRSIKGQSPPSARLPNVDPPHFRKGGGCSARHRGRRKKFPWWSAGGPKRKASFNSADIVRSVVHSPC